MFRIKGNVDDISSISSSNEVKLQMSVLAISVLSHHFFSRVPVSVKLLEPQEHINQQAGNDDAPRGSGLLF